MSIFKIKKNYPDDIVNVFNTLTISGKYQIIGSASLEKIKYSSDYDLQEFINKKGNNILDNIYNHFKQKFIECKKNKNYFITDFKCGIDNEGEPIRWSYNDMMVGKAGDLTFQEALIQKSTVKLDLIVLIDGIFTEFSENYYFKLNKKTTYYNDDNIGTSIKKSLNEYIYMGNYWKALKRLFSLLINDKSKNKAELTKLIDFFNSNVGLINKCKNELDILLAVIDQKFRKPKIDDIFYNITKINEWSKEAGLDFDFLSILRQRSINQIKKNIEILKNEIATIVNKYSLDFINKNFKNLV